MGEALGIDLRVAVCAAARKRGDDVAPCPLAEGSVIAPAVDLMPAGAGAVIDAASAMTGMLAAVAERALAGESLDAVGDVGVAFAVTPDDGPRMLAEQAAAAAFPNPLLVPRPVAVAAWFLHTNPRARDVTLATFEVDAGSVSVALVRRDRDGLAVLGLPAALPAPGEDVDLAAHLDGAVGLLMGIVADADLTPRAIDTIVLAGEPDWLDQLAIQAAVATGTPTRVEPDPELAPALGTALLAGGEERRLDATGLGLLGPVLLAGRVPPPPSAGVGATVGEFLDPAGGVGADMGAALLQEPAGDGVGSAMGEVLRQPTQEKVHPRGDKDVLDKSSSSGPRGIARRIGASLGPRGKIAAGVGTAVVVAVFVGAAVASGGGGGGDEGAVETDGPQVTEPDDDTADEPDDDTSTTSTSSTSVPGSTTSLPEGADPTDAGPVTPVDTPGGPVSPPSSPGTTASTTPTTSPRDSSPPTIGAVVASPLDISEVGFEFCELPTTSTVTARVSDASGIKSVTLSYSGNGTTGGGAMLLSGASYTGTIGTFPDSQLGIRETASVAFTVTATDNAGNQSTASSKLTLHGC